MSLTGFEPATVGYLYQQVHEFYDYGYTTFCHFNRLYILFKSPMVYLANLQAHFAYEWGGLCGFLNPNSPVLMILSIITVVLFASDCPTRI